mmetsp:Transcript_13856/g.35705  ORF Transcript_13856/g.35705 Transcript_13856/m.35705 type:complete len:211 (+) Transcript_13856:2121-2753(+)
MAAPALCRRRRECGQRARAARGRCARRRAHRRRPLAPRPRLRLRPCRLCRGAARGVGTGDGGRGGRPRQLSGPRARCGRRRCRVPAAACAARGGCPRAPRRRRRRHRTAARSGGGRRSRCRSLRLTHLPPAPSGAPSVGSSLHPELWHLAWKCLEVFKEVGDAGTDWPVLWPCSAHGRQGGVCSPALTRMQCSVVLSLRAAACVICKMSF